MRNVPRTFASQLILRRTASGYQMDPLENLYYNFPLNSWKRIIKDIFTIQNFAYFSLIKKRKHLLILKGHLAVDASSSSLSE